MLKKYLQEYPITQPYFDARVSDSWDEFAEEARSRPAFQLERREHKALSTDEA